LADLLHSPEVAEEELKLMAADAAGAITVPVA